MKTAYKILIGLIAVILVIVLIAGALVLGALGRIRRIELAEAAEIARLEQKRLAELKAAEAAEAAAADAENEFVLEDEVEQTALSEAELELIRRQAGNTECTNILLIGVDRRGDSGYSRADTILIATLDRKNGKLKLTSLMRDMYLPISGGGQNRINAACSRGGPGLLMDTINENFGMELTKYVLVDFNMFTSIVDELGGVTLELSEGEVSEANDCIAGLNKQQGRERNSGFIEQRSGVMTLDGMQALGYSRIRKYGSGDYSRTSRQFKVLRAIYDRFLDVDAAQKFGVIDVLLPYVETNLTNAEIIDIAASVLYMDADPSDLMHYRLPATGTFKSSSVRGKWVLLSDIPQNAKLLNEFIYEATEVEPLPGSDTF